MRPIASTPALALANAASREAAPASPTGPSDTVALGQAAEAPPARPAAPERSAADRENLLHLGTATFKDFGSPPSLALGADGTAYATSGARLVRVDAGGAATEIAKEEGAHRISPPAVDGQGNLYYRTPGGEVVARDPQGKEMWRVKTNERSTYMDQEQVGVLPDGTVWSVEMDHATQVVHTAKGGKKGWSYKLGDVERLVGITPDGERMYVTGNEQGNKVLHAVEPGRWTRKKRWKVEGLASKLHNAWIGSDGTPLVLRKDGSLAALDGEGSVRWTYGQDVKGLTPGLQGESWVQEGDGRTLSRLSPDGKLLERHEFPDHVFNLAVGSDGTLYANTSAGTVLARHPDGRVVEAPFPYRDTGALLVSPDGVLYTGTRRANLGMLKPAANEVHAFRLKSPESAVSQAPAPTIQPAEGSGWIEIDGIRLEVGGGA